MSNRKVRQFIVDANFCRKIGIRIPHSLALLNNLIGIRAEGEDQIVIS